ncbi:MAG: hypothetical protein ACE5K2_05255 [Candidatus Zixiibacteriota bacterium]
MERKNGLRIAHHRCWTPYKQIVYQIDYIRTIDHAIAIGIPAGQRYWRRTVYNL